MMKTCSKCGHINPAAAGFCGECGALLPEQTTGRTCGNCGYDNPTTASFCVRCGKSLVIFKTPPSKPKKRRFPIMLVASGVSLMFLMILAATAWILLDSGWLFEWIPDLKGQAGPSALVEPGSPAVPLKTLIPSRAPVPIATVTLKPSISPFPMPKTTTPTTKHYPMATETLPGTRAVTRTVGISPTPRLVENLEMIIESKIARNDTGLQVMAGDRINIEYTKGSWKAGPSPSWPTVGPEGDPQVSSKSTFPVRDARIMSLVAGVGENPPIAVGVKIQFESAGNGRLWLGANDDDWSDNDGSLTVRITLEK